MTDARIWVRADGKKPLRLDGRNASSTNPRSWVSYAEVLASSVGDGFGIMLGDGFAVYDFDHCFTSSGTLKSDVAKVVRGIAEPVLFVEVSCSGDGLHVFVRSDARSYRRGGVEFYSRARFVRMTCCPFRGWEGVRADA
jgi:primase-polymerase (primpol)-like protein